MKPIDFRNAQYCDIKALISNRRAEVLTAWRRYGPGTTAQVAIRSGINILKLRPRTTDLYQLGYLTLHKRQKSKTEGCYIARSDQEHLDWFKREQFDALEKAQIQMPFMETPAPLAEAKT